MDIHVFLVSCFGGGRPTRIPEYLLLLLFPIPNVFLAGQVVEEYPHRVDSFKRSSEIKSCPQFEGKILQFCAQNLRKIGEKLV